MEHMWSVLAGRVIVDSITGKISLIDIPELAGLLPSTIELAESNKVSLTVFFSFVNCFYVERSQGLQFEVRVSLYNPAGTKQTDSTIKVNEERLLENECVRLIHSFNNILFDGTGTYRFNVHIKKSGESSKWKKVASIPLQVSLQDAAT